MYKHNLSIRLGSTSSSKKYIFSRETPIEDIYDKMNEMDNNAKCKPSNSVPTSSINDNEINTIYDDLYHQICSNYEYCKTEWEHMGFLNSNNNHHCLYAELDNIVRKCVTISKQIEDFASDEETHEDDSWNSF